ncbi:hypothetical protein C0J52_08570 [Blattella germanica]|nr:hypothetical protein C0J52_08570 [Blattella germanica]
MLEPYLVPLDPLLMDVLKSLSSIRIRVGTSIKQQGGSIHAISQVVSHPNYIGADYDVAVIRVSQPFQYSESVQPISLTSEEPAAGTPVVVTGWGALEYEGSSPSQLQQVQVNIVDHEECSKAYTKYGGVTDREVCAGVSQGGKDSCQGDSGGPLVANGVQVGVVSWGEECALKGYPGVYSSVANLRSWILSQSGAVPRSLRPSLDGRIVGGTPADITNFPYQHWCGGSIISPNYVLIAAHCVRGKSLSSIRIRAGSSIKQQGGSIHAIAQVVSHPNYVGADYDVAVIRVSQPFQYSESVQPISLTFEEPAAGTPVVVTGWGALKYEGSSPSQLQQVQVNIVDHEECSKAYTKYGGVTAREVCAGVSQGGKDSCQGDSGGPLVANGVQVGVVSWGEECALKGYPGVYSSVANLRSWILSQRAVPRSLRPTLDGRIVGGIPADITNFPYQVSFEWYEQHWCGGSIISPNYVLIAAHCVRGKSLSSIRIRAGTSIKQQGGSIHAISQVVSHPNYVGADYDVAVIRVSQPFQYSESVQPISLTSEEPAAGTPVVVTGWGALEYVGSAPSQLQQVQVNIVDHEECSKAYTKYGGVTAREVCAGVSQGGKDSCQGDSGGPLVANGVQVGVVSWGEECALKGYPGVYSSVANLRSWILSQKYLLNDLPIKSISSIRIRAGSSYKEQGGSIHAISQVTMHPKYEGGDYDVAVIKVAQPFQYSDNVQPITLATKEPEAGTAVVVTGWGDLSSGGSSPSQLQQVQVNIVDHEECSRAYGGGVTDLEICAAVPEGGKDSCQGDSGGPLVANGQQVGVVSWGKGCALKGAVPHKIKHFPNGRIMGGTPAEITDYPYQEQGGSIHNVSEIRIHPQYQYQKPDYDIAVIKVSQPFEYNDTVHPIPLTSEEPNAGTPVNVSGWGDLSLGGLSPNQLQQVEVNIVDRQECVLNYEGVWNITERVICAGVSDGGKDYCTLDDGGPLVANGELVGIVSWGGGCGFVGYPGIYTNVANLKSWILSETGNE